MKTLLTATLLCSACNQSAPAVSPPDLGTIDLMPQFDLAPQLPVGVYGLSGFDPTLPDDDLKPLGNLVGDRGLVGVGESIHTSGGFQDSRARVIQYLVERKGFRLVSIEWQRDAGGVVEAYIGQGQGTAASAAAQLSVWASHEVQVLLQWLRTFNLSHSGDPVHFIGFDVQQPMVDLSTLQTFLNAAAGTDAVGLVQPLGQCDTGAGINGNMVMYVGDYKTCTGGIDAVDSYLSKNQKALVAASSLELFQRAAIASIGLRAWQGESYFYDSDLTRSYQSRDDAMAKVYLAMKSQQFPTLKSIVWAHNYHLRMNGVAVSGTGAVGAPTMGASLAASAGDDYFPIAQFAYDLSIDWPGVGCGAQPLPDSASIPGLLNQLPDDSIFVDLSFAGSPQPLFTAGQSYGENGYESSIPVQQYRALIFLKHSPKMAPLNWASCQ